MLREFTRPVVMGIVNATPDSFFDGSRTPGAAEAAHRASAMITAGAGMLDVGGYSTRPGAVEVSADEEYARLARVLELIRPAHPDAILSIDTFRADVARRCVEEWGADIVNDVSGGRLDPEMIPTVAGLRVPYVAMHMRGTPASMQQLTDYTDVVAEVLSTLAFIADECHQAGIADVIVDPGFGFAKNTEQNYCLLAGLGQLRALGLPILVGLSRKSMIWRPLGLTPADALPGTTALNTVALQQGADILRVHDVEAAAQAVAVVAMLEQAQAPSGNIQQIQQPYSPIRP